MRVLIVEDDLDISQMLTRGLTEEGFAVDVARDGAEGAHKAAQPVYDVIVLDLMLPQIDGLAVLRGLRGRGQTTPVLVLTARDAIADRIRGLDAGADDYLVKPFAFGELLARVRALMRRARGEFDPVVRVGPLSLDQSTRRVRWDQTLVDLSAREFAILQILMQHPDEVLSRTRIYEQVWNETPEIVSNVIDVHVNQIRKKLARAGAGNVISTVRGAGYRLEVPA
jgi:two-component system OmpR family response regulator